MVNNNNTKIDEDNKLILFIVCGTQEMRSRLEIFFFSFPFKNFFFFLFSFCMIQIVIIQKIERESSSNRKATIFRGYFVEFFFFLLV